MKIEYLLESLDTKLTILDESKDVILPQKSLWKKLKTKSFRKRPDIVTKVLKEEYKRGHPLYYKEVEVFVDGVSLMIGELRNEGWSIMKYYHDGRGVCVKHDVVDGKNFEFFMERVGF